MMYGFSRMNIGGMIMGGAGTMAGSAGGGRPRRPRKLTYILPHPEYDDKHVGGANAVSMGPGVEGADGEQLYTAGRDGTVRAWDLGGSAPSCALTMEGHSAWVNDLALLRSSVTGGGNALLSASSDRTVKVWNLDLKGDDETVRGHRVVHGAGDGHCVATLERHADYVMCVAAPTRPGATKFASAGLGSDQIYLWDINAVTAPIAASPTGGRKGSKENGSTFVSELVGQKESVYALAMDELGHTLVSGCSQNIVRVWDPRAGEKQMKLKGHTGIVRSATVDPTGRLCLTASSDHTLRLWDLGQQRCVQTLAGVHGCSVWCAVPDPSWHYVYSGGSDGRVYVTDLAHKRSALLFKDSHGVLSLCRDDGAGERLSSSPPGVWTATMGCDVRRWFTDAPEDPVLGGNVSASSSFGRERRGPRVSGGYGRAGLSARLEAEHAHGSPTGGPLSSSYTRSNGWFSAAAPLASSLSRSHGGGVGGHGGRSTPRHAPTAVHAIAAVTIAGAAPIVEHAQLNDRRRVLAKDASGAITLWDVTTCAPVKRFPTSGKGKADFAEILQAENETVSIPSWFSIDCRSGSLAVTISPSLSFGAEAYAVDMGVEGANDEIKLNLCVQTIHALLRDYKKARDARTSAADADRTDDVKEPKDVNALTPSEDAGVFPAPVRRPPLLCEAPGGAATVLMRSAGLEGTDAEEAALPEWIVEVVNGTYKVPDSPKLSFYLSPMEGQPTLNQGKVTAPRVLGIRKVCTYIIGKLNLEQGPGVLAEDLVEIMCNSQLVSADMSLATVSAFVWKRGDDVQLQYRVKKGVKVKADDGISSG